MESYFNNNRMFQRVGDDGLIHQDGDGRLLARIDGYLIVPLGLVDADAICASITQDGLIGDAIERRRDAQRVGDAEKVELIESDLREIGVALTDSPQGTAWACA